MQLIRLSEVDPNHLRDTFEQEIENWNLRLFWNYRPATELIRRYVRLRRLPGYVLRCHSGELVGYCYYVIDRPIGYIGNVYVKSEHATADAYELLLRQSFLALRASPEVERIESQIFDFNMDLLPLFRDLQFQTLRRHFLVLELDQSAAPAPSGDGVEITGWDQVTLRQVAQLIFDSYLESPDRDLCRDYQSPEGCSRFLRNVVENPGCGEFCPDTSLVALDRSGYPAAVLLSSVISPRTGMIPQISVRTRYQGQGIGTRLLQSYFARARQAGLTRVTLSVTARNRRACELYDRLGFRRLKDFFAYIWSR